MSATSVTLRGQAAAEALMVDTCTVRRQAGSTTDQETGVVTPTYTVVYSGKCRFQQRGETTATDVGEAQIYVTAMELQLPIAVTAVLPEDRVTADTSLDPAVAGKTYVVRGVLHKTHATMRRLPIEEVAR